MPDKFWFQGKEVFVASSGDLVTRAAGLANRLRLVQMDFADESPDLRREQLAEEVERALSQIDPTHREEFLKMVEERFPTWDQNVQVAAVATQAAPAAQSITDARELRDPSFLVSRLAELGKGMTDEQRAAVAEALRKAGFTQASASGWPEEAAEQVRTAVQPPASSPLDAHRTVELAAILAELAQSLDQVVWQTWKQLAPTSNMRRSQALKTTLQRYITGDRDTARGQVKQDVERLRQLTAALIASVSQAGRGYGQKWDQNLSVAAIKGAVSASGWSSKEGQYWKKYEELASNVDIGTIERDIQQEVVKFVEGVVQRIRG
jgi:hypothetical protein